MLHQCPDEIENGEAFDNPARVLGCAASECMSRLSGRLQLAPAGHVRSIVNSVRERVREKRALCDGMSDAFKSQHYKQNLSVSTCSKLFCDGIKLLVMTNR